MIDLTYVIPVWNKHPLTTDLCRKALRSIEEFNKGLTHEVICIDNRSPEHEVMTQSQLRELWGTAKVLSLPENIGFGKACNLGFQLARGHWLCCMNSDVELLEDSCAMLVEVMQHPSDHALGKGIDRLHVGMPDNWNACQYYKYDKDDRIMRPWYFGAFWVAERTLIWDEFQGFDEEYEMCYWEDSDLWRRMESKGYVIGGWRGTWVKHASNASRLPNMPEFFNRNKERYEAKWGPKQVRG
jgi:GT2 family glycosyltransferase